MKLENILVDSEGFIKIIDYGLAKMLKEDEESQSFCGTPEYLAPEMVLQQGHDKNVDWFVYKKQSVSVVKSADSASAYLP